MRCSEPVIALWLQSTGLAGWVAELGSLEAMNHGNAALAATLSLWRDSDLRSTAVSHFNELQLFDLPPLRCALGILRCEFG